MTDKEGQTWMILSRAHAGEHPERAKVEYVPKGRLARWRDALRELFRRLWWP